MKTNIVVASTLLSFLMFSCKNENKEVIQEPVVNNLQVSLDLIIIKDDSLQLFYKDEAIPSFNEENSIIVPVKGNSSVQQIVFDLPEEIVPTELRFDIGNKMGQDPIQIQNFIMKYKEKLYEAKDSTMLYFATNDQLKYETKTKTLSHVEVKGQPYDPFIYSTPILTQRVKNIYKK